MSAAKKIFAFYWEVIQNRDLFPYLINLEILGMVKDYI